MPVFLFCKQNQEPLLSGMPTRFPVPRKMSLPRIFGSAITLVQQLNALNATTFRAFTISFSQTGGA